MTENQTIGTPEQEAQETKQEQAPKFKGPTAAQQQSTESTEGETASTEEDEKTSLPIKGWTKQESYDGPKLDDAKDEPGH